MDEFKIVVPEIRAFDDMANTINSSGIDVAELCAQVHKEVDDFSAAEDYFQTEVDDYLEKLAKKIEETNTAVIGKEKEIDEVKAKIQQCDDTLKQYNDTRNVIDDEKVGVSEEVNDLYDNTPQGEKINIAQQVQHVTELDEQGLQLTSDVIRVKETKAKYKEDLAVLRSEYKELKKNLDTLEKKNENLRSRYISFMTNFKAVITLVQTEGLADIDHEKNRIHVDAAQTAIKLQNIAAALKNIK